MPSGAKKRKAAKKKKENQSNNNPTPSSASTQTHGDGDDVKHQDDKDSDVGEISSPASDQDHHYNFSGGEEEIGKEIEVIDEPRKIVVEESFVPVEREFTIENESDKKDGKFEHDEVASKSYDGGSSRSSSSNSSSDDESCEIKKSQAENISLSGEEAEMDISSQANNSIEESELKETEKAFITTECIAQETDDRLSLSYNAPIASADNGADHEKDSGVSETLLAPAPHPEQTTSWKSCCGLFEVFTGSGR